MALRQVNAVADDNHVRYGVPSTGGSAGGGWGGGVGWGWDAYKQITHIVDRNVSLGTWRSVRQVKL